MDWKELGKTLVGKGLPLLGTALLGPGGGAAGALVSSALGLVDSKPEAVVEALTLDPQAVITLRTLEMQHKEKLEQIALDQVRVETEERVTQLKEVNSTMRTEATSEHWPQYSWRPFWGFASGLAFLVICVYVCVLGWKALKGDPAAMNMIPQMISSFATLFMIPGAILGVSAWHRGMAKRKATAEGV